jgi:hypothetical protein
MTFASLSSQAGHIKFCALVHFTILSSVLNRLLGSGNFKAYSIALNPGELHLSQILDFWLRQLTFTLCSWDRMKRFHIRAK